MTREQIEAMPAGREMDAEIHQRVMGQGVKFVSNWPWLSDSGDWCETFSISRDFAGNEIPQPIPRYSTDIADAWRVVERFAPYVKIDGRGDGNGNWSCSVWVGGPEITGYGETAPLAVCRAALIAESR